MFPYLQKKSTFMISFLKFHLAPPTDPTLTLNLLTRSKIVSYEILPPSLLLPPYNSLWDPESMKLSDILEQSPRDWETTTRQNVVLTVFHTWWHIFCVWNTNRTTFGRVVVSQSRRDCSKLSRSVMYSGSQSETYIIIFLFLI